MSVPIGQGHGGGPTHEAMLARAAPPPNALQRLRRWLGRDAAWGYLFVAPQVIGLVVFIFGPIIVSLVMSFLDINLVTLESRWVGLTNYQALFVDRTFRQALMNTLYFTVVSVPLGMVVSLVMALALAANVRFETAYRAIYFLPTITSTIVMGIVWAWLLNPQYGLVNQVLLMMGIKGPGWISSPEWAMPSIILVALWHGFGYNMILFLAGLKNVPRELYEAAKVDGATTFQRFRHVTLPMISPTTFFVAIITVIASFRVFEFVYMMTGGGPADSTVVLLLRMYQVGFSFLKLGPAAAISWVLFLMIMVATFVQFRASRWVHYG
jgi:multiple sugar transport system permease protein